MKQQFILRNIFPFAAIEEIMGTWNRMASKSISMKFV